MQTDRHNFICYILFLVIFWTWIESWTRSRENIKSRLRSASLRPRVKCLLFVKHIIISNTNKYYLECIVGAVYAA